MVIGGQAVLLYGEPRLTKDIDITLGVGPEKLGTVKEDISNMGFKVLVENPEEFVQQTMVLPVIHEKSHIRIDFVFSTSHYEKQAIERATIVKLGNTLVRFASLEDVIIHKIVAGRSRDLEDVRVILLKNQQYDSHYITNWLMEFDKSLDTNFLQVFKNICSDFLH
jgi:predicted nucleotidyltransferase